MKRLDVVWVGLLLIAILLIVLAVNALDQKVQNRQACLTSVETRYGYIERKLCDPYAEEACKIDPQLQTELGDWYEREVAECK